MKAELKKKIRRWNIVTHRDVGYVLSGLIIAYCISGLALNHVDEWNPDFIIEKNTIHFEARYKASQVNKDNIAYFNNLVGEEKYKVFDMPTSDQVKIYYDNASLHLNFTTNEGLYERITKRPLFYQVNVLHRNSLKGWKWVADIFSVMLIVICVTGLFILKGANSLQRRGKWLVLAGLLPPLIAIIIQAIL